MPAKAGQAVPEQLKGLHVYHMISSATKISFRNSVLFLFTLCGGRHGPRGICSAVRVLFDRHAVRKAHAAARPGCVLDSQHLHSEWLLRVRACCLEQQPREQRKWPQPIARLFTTVAAAATCSNFQQPVIGSCGDRASRTSPSGVDAEQAGWSKSRRRGPERPWDQS